MGRGQSHTHTLTHTHTDAQTWKLDNAHTHIPMHMETGKAQKQTHTNPYTQTGMYMCTNCKKRYHVIGHASMCNRQLSFYWLQTSEKQDTISHTKKDHKFIHT